MERVFLDARLAAVAARVRPGVPVADIGCDHGKLSAFLAQSGRSPRVIAADLRAEPLATAQENVRRAGQTDKIDCRLGNGLSVIAPDEVADIVIAGMGGETIAEILEAAPWTKNARYHFVFVPATCHAELRCWLYAHGYALQSETPVAQSGYCYTVMEAVYTGECVQKDALFCALGLHLGQKGEATLRYLRKVQAKLEKELRGKRASARYSNLSAEEALCRAVAEEVTRCQE